MASGDSQTADSATTAHSVWRNFRSHRLALASGAVLAALALLALGAPLISAFVTGLQPDATDLGNLYASASAKYWFGADELGRDVFTRIVYGGRVSLAFGITAALASALIGITVGALAAFYGGWLDNLLMRFTDTLLSLPILPLMIILSAVELDKLLPLPPGDYLQVVRLVAIIVFFSWMTMARDGKRGRPRTPPRSWSLCGERPAGCRSNAARWAARRWRILRSPWSRSP